MKHLKSYRVFENKEITQDLYNQIKPYLSNVFLELEDNSFEFMLNIEPNKIFIMIRKEPYYSDGFLKYDFFKTSEVLPTIEHTISYLSDIDFNLDMIRALIKTEIEETGSDELLHPPIPQREPNTNLNYFIKWELITVKDLEEDYNCKEIRLVFR